MKNILWKIAGFLLIIAALLGILIFRGRDRETALASIDAKQFSSDDPLIILEIVPYEGLGLWGYMVPGNEPVTSDEINAYYSGNESLKKYFWSNGSDGSYKEDSNEKFDQYFMLTGLEVARDAKTDAYQFAYRNPNLLVNRILCAGGQNEKDWAPDPGKSNWKVRVKTINAKDVTVADVEEADMVIVNSNNSANAGIYGQKAPHLRAYLKYKKADPQDPDSPYCSETVQFQYLQDDNTPGYEGELSTDGGATWASMDIKPEVARAIADCAFGYSADGSEKACKPTIAMLDDTTAGWVNKNTEMRKLQVVLCDLSAKTYQEDDLRNRIWSGEFDNGTVWKSGMFVDNFYNMGDTYEAGYYMVGTINPDNYLSKQKYDNVIRCSPATCDRKDTFTDPIDVRDIDQRVLDIFEILNDETLTRYRSVRVLEIEPSNSYWTEKESSAKKNLNKALGLSEENPNLEITTVTPNQLNGMTVDLCAEYDLILVGDRTDGLFSGNSYFGRAEYNPYYHIGYYADAVIPSTMLNGLLSDDYTTMADFAQQRNIQDAVYKKADGSPFDGTKKLLKNIDLEYKNNGSWNVARLSGNDITDYMQDQLAAFVNAGKPVILLNQMYEKVTEGIASFNAIDLNPDTWNDPKLRPGNENYETYMDANLYFALAGVSDESKITSTIDRLPSNIYTKAAVSGNTNTVNWSSRNLYVTVDESASIVEVNARDEKKKDLTALTPADTLSFTYSITLPAGDTIASYDVMVVIDQNGDGIFDTGNHNAVKGDSEHPTIRGDAVYQLDPVAGDSNHLSGSFTAPEKLDTLEEVYQFRVIVKRKDSQASATWTGYIRPVTGQEEVRILQVTPDTTKSSDTAWIDLFNAAGGAFTISTDHPVQKTKESDFHQEYASENTALDQSEETLQAAADTLHSKYHLIIIGTDFSSSADQGYSDLEEYDALVLRQYVKSQYPIIFTADSISYINDEAYDTMKTSWDYKEYTKISVSTLNQESSDSVLMNSNQWNYWMTKHLRDAIGMDRFGITLEQKEEENRDRGSVRRWAEIAGKDKKELQGFTNAALMTYSYNYRSQVLQCSNSGITLKQQIYASRIRGLNEGAVGSYPYQITSKTNDYVSLKERSHAPYYQLYLDRNLDGNNEDVTVWYTLEAREQNPWYDDIQGTDEAYFKASSGDAGNNYYLYSKGKTFYTGFSMYGDKPGTTEMKLFVNTIYAALNSVPAVQESSGYYETVVEENPLIQQYGQRSDDPAVPNRYLCYYTEESELETWASTIQFQINHEPSEMIAAVVYLQSAGQDAEPKQTYSSVATGTIQDLVLGDTGPYTKHMDGETLVIRPLLSSPDQLYIRAEITFIQRELFDLD
jgi:hypothetical protein